MTTTTAGMHPDCVGRHFPALARSCPRCRGHHPWSHPWTWTAQEAEPAPWTWLTPRPVRQESAA